MRSEKSLRLHRVDLHVTLAFTVNVDFAGFTTSGMVWLRHYMAHSGYCAESHAGERQGEKRLENY